MLQSLPLLFVHCFSLENRRSNPRRYDLHGFINSFTPLTISSTLFVKRAHIQKSHKRIAILSKKQYSAYSQLLIVAPIDQPFSLICLVADPLFYFGCECCFFSFDSIGWDPIFCIIAFLSHGIFLAEIFYLFVLDRFLLFWSCFFNPLGFPSCFLLPDNFFKALSCISSRMLFTACWAVWLTTSGAWRTSEKEP